MDTASISSESGKRNSEDIEMDIEPEEASCVRKRDDFTSEIYKIEISNMGNFGYGVRNQD